MTNLQKIQSERILKSYGVSPIQKDIDLNIIAEKCNDSFNKGIITENEFNSAIDYFEDLMKARNVKYFKREGTAGNYKYYYSEAEYKQKKGLESKKEEDGGIKMNNLDWGSSTAERNENLDKFNSLKTKEEKESFKKELKAKNESGDKKDGLTPEEKKKVDTARKYAVGYLGGKDVADKMTDREVLDKINKKDSEAKEYNSNKDKKEQPKESSGSAKRDKFEESQKLTPEEEKFYAENKKKVLDLMEDDILMTKKQALGIAMKDDVSLKQRVRENQSRKSNISDSEHKSNYNSFLSDLKKEKTIEGLNSKYKAIADKKEHIDMPVSLQNDLADEVEKIESKLPSKNNIKKSESTDPYDILKSDITYSLGNFSNPIEFSKKGSEIKDMVKTKLPVLQGKLQQCELECDLIKEQAKEKGVDVDKIYSEFESRGYAYLDESTPNVDSSDNLQLKLINLLYKKKDLKSDISTLEIVLDGIEDNKSYKLNINQIKSLKND